MRQCANLGVVGVVWRGLWWLGLLLVGNIGYVLGSTWIVWVQSVVFLIASTSMWYQVRLFRVSRKLIADLELR